MKMDIKKKVVGQQFLLDAQEELLKEYEKELKRLQIKNLKLKLHMDIIVRTPLCNTAAKLRKEYSKADFSESVIYCN